MQGRFFALLSWALLVSACSSSSSSGASDDANPCPDPNTVVTGASCSVSIECTAAERCLQCGLGSYIRDAQSCACTGGKWACPVYDCGPYKPGTYSDSACTTLNPTPDTGGDGDGDGASDTADAADANEAG